MEASLLWKEYQPTIVRMAHKAYCRSPQKWIFEKDDYLQEGAICLLSCLNRYKDAANFGHLLLHVIKNRYTTILRSQYYQFRFTAPLSEDVSGPEDLLLDLSTYKEIAKDLSPLASQVLWLLVEPPDDLWDLVAHTEVSKLSRKIVAQYLGVAPQRVSEAVQEIKKVLLA